MFNYSVNFIYYYSNSKFIDYLLYEVLSVAFPPLFLFFFNLILFQLVVIITPSTKLLRHFLTNIIFFPRFKKYH